MNLKPVLQARLWEFYNLTSIYIFDYLWNELASGRKVLMSENEKNVKKKLFCEVYLWLTISSRNTELGAGLWSLAVDFNAPWWCLVLSWTINIIPVYLCIHCLEQMYWNEVAELMRLQSLHNYLTIHVDHRKGLTVGKPDPYHC